MSTEKRKILIVDDEIDAGFTITVMLEQYGFNVDFFTNPMDAVKNFKPGYYDLIILDIKMPEINGFEVYDQFKAKDASIKTLFLTALSDVEPYNTQSSKVYPVMGERHFAMKPISNNDLLQQVYSIIS